MAKPCKKGAYWTADKALGLAQPIGAAAATAAGGYLGWNYGSLGSPFDTVHQQVIGAAMGAPIAGGLAHASIGNTKDWLQQKMFDLDQEYEKN